MDQPSSPRPRPCSLAHALASGVVILDGGLATELQARGHDVCGVLWSARLLREEPAAVAAAHRAFADAGAQVATTASYQASFEGFARAGIDEAEAVRLFRHSVTLAREGGAAPVGPCWVAASIGPYGAVLAGGEEYTGAYVDREWTGRARGGMSVAELRDFHVRRMVVLAEAGPDVFAIETIPALAEVEAVLDALAVVGTPAWVSLTTVVDPDGVVRTRRGERATEAFAMAADSPHVIAVGANCMHPDGATAVVAATADTGLPGVVYPNSGETWLGRDRRWTGPSQQGWTSRDWVRNGARLLGGCCRTSPADIAELVRIHS